MLLRNLATTVDTPMVDRRLALTTVAVVALGIALLLVFHPWDHNDTSTFHVVGYDCKAGYDASVSPSAPDGYVCVRQ